MATQYTSSRTLRLVLILIATIVLLPILLMMFAFPIMGSMSGQDGSYTSGMDGTGYSPMMDGGGIFAIWGLGMMLIFLIVLLGAAYLFYRIIFVRGRVAPKDPAVEELRQAYARGELTEEEYESRRKKLQGEREE